MISNANLHTIQHNHRNLLAEHIVRGLIAQQPTYPPWHPEEMSLLFDKALAWKRELNSASPSDSSVQGLRMTSMELFGWNIVRTGLRRKEEPTCLL